MKVREWIEKLSEFPPDDELVTDDPGCGCCSVGKELVEYVAAMPEGGQVYIGVRGVGW